MGESAPLWGMGHAPLGEGMFILTWWLGKGVPLLQRAGPFAEGGPFWKRALSECHIENLTY